MITDKFKVLVNHEESGEIEYQIYQMKLMFGEEVKGQKRDWVTFNNEKLILDVAHFDISHWGCHKNFKDENAEDVKEAELKGTNHILFG